MARVAGEQGAQQGLAAGIDAREPQQALRVIGRRRRKGGVAEAPGGDAQPVRIDADPAQQAALAGKR